MSNTKTKTKTKKKTDTKTETKTRARTKAKPKTFANEREEVVEESNNISNIIVIIAIIGLVLLGIFALLPTNNKKDIKNLVPLGSDFKGRVGDYNELRLISYQEYLNVFGSNTKINKNTFENNNVYVLELTYDYCGNSEFEVTDFQKIDEKYKVNIQYLRVCDTCGIRYAYYALLIPKDEYITQNDMVFEYDTKNNLQCADLSK